jgi:hypothetical protein
MARRRNSIAKRFAKMRGLPPGEKALMQRVADLMDAALNNRQASNPFEEGGRRLNRQVYPPTGLLAQQGVGSVKLVWDAANSNEHLRYGIEFTNMTTGESITKSSYTNNIIFRGENGTYLAKVFSVGRDGSRSTLKQVEFGIGNDVMLIEGAKNGPLELGTLVQDNMKLYKDFSIYVWGHVVLDKQTLDINNDVVFRLYRAEWADASFSDAYLVQTITLYSATESGNSLDTTARGGLITRPAAARPGTFETTQSIMFSPMEVLDEDDDKTVTFFLQTTNRAEEQDEVNLSLTMWAGQDGVGSAVPGDTWEPPSPYVFPFFDSFHNQAPGWQAKYPADTRTAVAYVPDGYSMIGNEWTLAFWYRVDDSDAGKMSAAPAEGSNPNGGTMAFFSKALRDSTGVYQPNSIRILISSIVQSIGVYNHVLDIDVGWFNSSITKNARYQARAHGDRNQISTLFPWGDAIYASEDDKDIYNNAWMFMVVCFTGGYHQGGVPKIRTYLNSAKAGMTHERPEEPRMMLLAPTSDSTDDPIVQNDEGAVGYQHALPQDGAGASVARVGIYNGDLQSTWITNRQIHMVGIWNTALDSTSTQAGWNIGPIEAIFNNGRSGVMDWKHPIDHRFGDSFPYLNYTQHGNLVHQIKHGAVEKAFTSHETLRDTGYFLPDGDANFTASSKKDTVNGWFSEWWVINPLSIRYRQREVPFGSGDWFDGFGQSWTRGTDIYDILSPLGTNSTTQYDYSYPGQNMVSEHTQSNTAELEYPSFAEWTAAGSVISNLPWVSGPYPPGYHRADPDRPIIINE